MRRASGKLSMQIRGRRKPTLQLRHGLNAMLVSEPLLPLPFDLKSCCVRWRRRGDRITLLQSHLHQNGMKELGYRIVDLARGIDAVGLLSDLRRRQYDDPVALQRATVAERDAYFDELRRAVLLFRSASRFSELPILDKAFIAAHREELTNPGYRGKLIRKMTGGSTGEPLVYMTGPRSQSYLWAGIFLSWEAAGFQLGDRVALLGGAALFGSGWKHAAYYQLLKVTPFSSFDMSAARMSSYIEDISAGQFKLVYGYASAIHLLAQYILRNTKPAPTLSLKAIVCTSDMLTPAMRCDIEVAFGAPCFNQYGCHDAGVSAFECDHHAGLHLISTRSYVEVLQDGRLISTDLSNQAMFLPRYDSGDIVAMSDVACTCGRGFPLITELKGRQNDIVRDASGHAVHSQFFLYLLREDPDVKAFQVLFDDDELVVNIQVDEINVEAHKVKRDRYVRRIGEVLQFSGITFEYNQPFVTTRNGKRSFVVRRSSAILRQ